MSRNRCTEAGDRERQSLAVRAMPLSNRNEDVDSGTYSSYLFMDVIVLNLLLQRAGSVGMGGGQYKRGGILFSCTAIVCF